MQQTDQGDLTTQIGDISRRYRFAYSASFWRSVGEDLKLLQRSELANIGVSCFLCRKLKLGAKNIKVLMKHTTFAALDVVRRLHAREALQQQRCVHQLDFRETAYELEILLASRAARQCCQTAAIG